MKNIVLVHGGFVDGRAVEGLQDPENERYSVSIVQIQISLEDDVAVTKRTLSAGRTYNSRLPFPTGAVNQLTRVNHQHVFRPRIQHRCLPPDRASRWALLLRGPAARRARTADTPPARRFFVPRQGEVPALFAEPT